MGSDINFKKVFLISLIISLSISALLGIIIFLIGNFGEIQGHILFTTLAIGGFSLTGLCCATLLEKKRFSAFAIFGIIVSIWGFLFQTSLIWEIMDFSSFDNIWKVMIITIILAFSTAHASLLLLLKSDKNIVNVSLVTTILFLTLVALELVILVLSEFHNINNMWYRILGVFAILDVLGTIVTPILLKVASLHDKKKH
ncbi:hypothetical protein HYX13_00665 [Candidatus Woesearchaeota archaeon]|nr:hypothetical protein [Candidatus Woesearchaeota archaeon]